MRKFLVYNILVVCLIVTSNLISQMPYCTTNANFADLLQQTAPLSYPSNNNYLIRISVHIVRKSNGNGGITNNELLNSLAYLKQAFEPYGICFSLSNVDEIWNDYVYFNSDLGQLKILKSTSNAIDIYIGDSTVWNQGQADNIPGKAFLIGGKLFGNKLANSYVIAHEMGHCLGLFHTFHGLCEPGCPELVNGSNCITCGDFVCDTPADPQQFQTVKTGANSCVWAGITCGISNVDANNQSYQPDPYNIMSYTIPECMQYFTNGQATRMKLYLTNSTLLQSVIIPNNYTKIMLSLTGTQNITYAALSKIIFKSVSANFFPGILTLKAGEEISIEDESTMEGEFVAEIDTFCSIINEINSARLFSPTVYTANNYTNTLLIFPNPSSHSINIFSDTNIQSITIKDLTGKILLQENFSAPSMQPPLMYPHFPTACIWWKYIQMFLLQQKKSLCRGEFRHKRAFFEFRIICSTDV
ncbi:MAG: hypothetical protein KatS3mg028_1062 [Bacteroidia bacterium]|nr:MAG: hypothetical protein KatS3mg028_1062 [Bacteroidia bacterium]